MPFRSSLTGETRPGSRRSWTAETDKQWTQPIGYMHALYEVGIAALRTSADPRNKEAVRRDRQPPSVDTIVGPVNFKDSPIKNVAPTQMAMGQWRQKTGRFKYDLLITSNVTAPDIKPEAEMKLLSHLG